MIYWKKELTSYLLNLKKLNSMQNVFRYIGYFTVSLFLGWMSTLGKNDFVQSIEHSIVPILLALLTLSTTLSAQLVNEIRKFKEKHPTVVTKDTIDAMKRNVVIELGVIATTFLVLVIKDWLELHICSYTVQIIANTVVVFSVLYYCIVIYDSSMGLYDIMKGDDTND